MCRDVPSPPPRVVPHPFSFPGGGVGGQIPLIDISL